MPGIARLVALGASNLTRGFRRVVSTARAAWGPEIQVLAALGHGRSYGAASRIGVRTLAGISNRACGGHSRPSRRSPPVPSSRTWGTTSCMDIQPGRRWPGSRKRSIDCDA